MEHYFYLLGLNLTASLAEIKTAYRKLAKQYHPDVNKNIDATAKFKAITEAYAACLKYKERVQQPQPQPFIYQGWNIYNGTEGTSYTIYVRYY